ncbi:MAG: response regulator [Pseudobdellovibrio sp.]
MSKYVLVVEDNPSDLILTSAYIEKMGYAPIRTSGGREALSQINDFDFKLIIVDLQMPKMSGIDFITAVRQMSQFKKIPILVTSARQESKDVMEAVHVGANDYLVKPIDGLIFEEKFNKLIGKTDDWKEYLVNSRLSEESAGHVKKIFQVISLSEVGITVESNELWKEGENIELIANIFKNAQINFVLSRVISCKKNGSKYRVNLSFVGLTDDIRYKIRQICRLLWNKNREVA